MSTNPTPLSDQEIEEIETCDRGGSPNCYDCGEYRNDSQGQLLATIRQRTQERDRLAEQFDLEVGRSLLVGRERDRLRQCLWDCFRIAGGDTDGEATPRSLVSDIVPLALDAVKALRAESDAGDEARDTQPGSRDREEGI